MSLTFAQYVVGDFSVDGVATDTVDPFSVAQRYADTPAPRFLADEIKKWQRYNLTVGQLNAPD